MEIHPLKNLINREVHARPFRRLYPDLDLLHITVCYKEEDRQTLKEQLSALLEQNNLPEPESIEQFFFVSNDEQAIRFEPHNEFYTLTVYNLDNKAAALTPDVWRNLPGKILCGLELDFLREDQAEPVLKDVFPDNQVAGSYVMGQAAKIWTDFMPRGERDFVKTVVKNQSLVSYQSGRLLQRLCEIDTYRHMALLALPEARSLMPVLTEMDQALAEITHRIADKNNTPELLQELMTLAAKVEKLSAETSNRFAASEAYFEVLDSRISELREARIQGLQTIEQFIERRLSPARKTCLAASVRLERLSTRITRTTELLRSQVDLSVEAQNQQLLEALNSRSQRQLRLQAKLESFTIIVVTYYAFDLFERTIRNTVSSDVLRDDILLWVSFSVPLVAGALWWYVRRLLRLYGEE